MCQPLLAANSAFLQKASLVWTTESDHLFFRKVLFFRKSGNKIIRTCLLFHQDDISGNLNFRKYFM